MLGREGPAGVGWGNSALPRVTPELLAMPLRGARASLLEKEPGPAGEELTLWLCKLPFLRREGDFWTRPPPPPGLVALGAEFAEARAGAAEAGCGRWPGSSGGVVGSRDQQGP